MANGETLNDEIKEQREKLKDASFSEKATYFWYYYKLHVIIITCVIVTLSCFLYQYFSKKEAAFTCVTLNADTRVTETQSLEDGLAEYMNINPKRQQIVIETQLNIIDSDNAFANEDAYYSQMRLQSMFAASEVDALASVADKTEAYAREGLFLDLREVLDDELYAQLADKNLIYICMDHDNNPIPAAVKISESEVFSSLGAYDSDKNVYAGCVLNTKHPERFELFIKYLFSL